MQRRANPRPRGVRRGRQGTWAGRAQLYQHWRGGGECPDSFLQFAGHSRTLLPIFKVCAAPSLFIEKADSCYSLKINALFLRSSLPTDSQNDFEALWDQTQSLGHSVSPAEVTGLAAVTQGYSVPWSFSPQDSWVLA